MAHGGQVAVRDFKMMGTDCIFTLRGWHIMTIYLGCMDEGSRSIDVRHEQAAAHAADAYSRLNPGKVGIAVVTAGPGVTDSVTGVTNAWRANSPMLCIGGQGPFANYGRGSLQEMDHVGLMRPITKWAGACVQTERIPEFIELAIRHAVTGIPGPVYLEIPMDVLMSDAGDIEKVKFPKMRTAAPLISAAREEAEAALDVLSGAQRPMMMVGTSVKWSNAGDTVHEFLKKTNVPAYVNGMGRGQLPPDSPHLFNRTRRDAIKNCDVIVLAGCLLDFRMKFGGDIPKNAKIIQLEMDNTLVGHNRAADVALVGNLKSSFETMNAILDQGSYKIDFKGYSDELRKKENESAKGLADAETSDAKPIKSARMCRDVADFVGRYDDMIVIGDGGDIVAQSAKVVPIPPKGGWMDPGPLGTLGVGMPFALAAQACNPDKKVLIIYGDGSFGLNGFEFDTAVRHNLPVVGIVGNDAAWGQMMRPQGAFYGHYVAVDLEYTRYDKIVEAMGGHGEYVEDPNDIIPALERAFDSGKAACVNVVLERDREYKGGGYV